MNGKMDNAESFTLEIEIKILPGLITNEIVFIFLDAFCCVHLKVMYGIKMNVSLLRLLFTFNRADVLLWMMNSTMISSSYRHSSETLLVIREKVE